MSLLLKPFRRKAVAETPELRRIRALPRRKWTELELERLADEMTATLKTPTGTMRLRPIQALALHDIGTHGGLFGPIRVGGGKTLTSLLAPYILEAKRPMLLLPASLVEKTERERRALSLHWRLPKNIRIHSYEMLGRVQAAETLTHQRPDLIIADEAHRLKNKKAGVTRRVVRYMREHPGTHFVAISGTIMSKSLRDFAHLLRWSLPDGAPIPSSEGELEEWADALDDNVNMLQRVDPGALLSLCQPGDIDPEDDTRSARRGFQRRLVESPGVVATSGESVACSLYVNAIQYPVNATTEANFRKLRTQWETPDGWALSEAVAVWRHARELALGMHYVWFNYSAWRACLQAIQKNEGSKLSLTERKILSAFVSMTERDIEASKVLEALANVKNTDCETATGSPSNSIKPSSINSTGAVTSVESAATGSAALCTLIMIMRQEKSEGFCASRVTSLSALSETIFREWPALWSICKQAQTAARPPDEWMARRRLWAQYVREVLKHSRTLDTELQVANACRNGALDASALDGWAAIRETFTPSPKALWHDTSALEICQTWMAQGPGIVWCEHTFFAEELSRRTGAPYYGAQGQDRYRRPIESADPNVAIIASVAANSTGRNLQAWSRNLVTSCPTGASMWEQLLGRTHRDGQLADEVTADVLFGCFEHFDGFQKALAGARTAQDTLGQTQKLLLADVDFPTDIDMARLAGARWQKSALASGADT